MKIESLISVKDQIAHILDEERKTSCALYALRSFCNADFSDRPEFQRHANIMFDPDTFYGLLEIVSDYISANLCELEALSSAVKDFRIK